MGYMFYVRSSPCTAPNMQSSPPLHAACAAVARRLPPPGPHLAPHRMPSVRLSAVRVGVQPAAELRHLQRHGHALHVQCALLPVHCPESAVEPSPAPACTAVACHIPPPGSHLAPHRMPPFRPSAVRVGVQPAAELRHLQRHGHVPHVLRALLPVPCPESAVEPSPARCVRRGRLPHPASRLPGRTLPRTVCPPFDSRQYASAFNQPLSFDTSSVTRMGYMFTVRPSPRPAPICSRALSPARCLHRGRPPPPASQPATRTAAYALPATRQSATSLSNANKLLIRCAWAGTSAFASAGYGSSWGLGSCSLT
eukprot:scaffold9957_cov44-Phaeocystis_antarctica.AAC.4